MSRCKLYLILTPVAPLGRLQHIMAIIAHLLILVLVQRLSALLYPPDLADEYSVDMQVSI